MDSFSLLPGTVGLLAICTHFVLSLRDIHAAAATTDCEIEALSRDVKAGQSLKLYMVLWGNVWVGIRAACKEGPGSCSTMPSKSWLALSVDVMSN